MAHLQEVEPSLNDGHEMVNLSLPSSMTAITETSASNNPPVETIERVYRHTFPVRLMVVARPHGPFTSSPVLRSSALL